MSTLQSIFSIPVWKTKIDKTEYDKDLVLGEMLHNFSVDPKRNKWDEVENTLCKSNWHHSNHDDNNESFKEISYVESGLADKLNERIIEFINYLNLTKDINYEFDITNYTVSKEGYFLTSHGHGGDDFSSVLFLQYDKKTHPSTVFNNPDNSSMFNRIIQKDLYESIDSSNPFFSYFHDDWQIDTEEDDYLIFPGHVKHEVPLIGKTNKPRVTLSINIRLKR